MAPACTVYLSMLSCDHMSEPDSAHSLTFIPGEFQALVLLQRSLQLQQLRSDACTPVVSELMSAHAYAVQLSLQPYSLTLLIEARALQGDVQTAVLAAACAADTPPQNRSPRALIRLLSAGSRSSAVLPRHRLPELEDGLVPVRLGLVRGGRQQHALLLAEARAELNVEPQHHGMDRTGLRCTAGLRARSGIFEAGHPLAQLAVSSLPILQAKLEAMRHLHIAWKLSSEGHCPQVYLQGEVCSEVGLLRRHAGQVKAAQLAGLCHNVFCVDWRHMGCLQAILQQLPLYWPAKFEPVCDSENSP